jgi:hypothetical protein
VESYPEDTVGRQVSGSFLHNGTVTMFERHGFERDRQIGKAPLGGEPARRLSLGRVLVCAGQSPLDFRRTQRGGIPLGRQSH